VTVKRRTHHHEKTGELNLVPYLDIMVNLTLFMLVSMTSVIQFGILNVSAPTYGAAPPAAAQKKAELLLTVAISTRGFIVAGAGGQQPIIELQDGKYDYPALTRKMVEVKDLFPEESKVILTADQSVSYEVVVATMDAVRDHEGRRLFYDVVLGAL